MWDCRNVFGMTDRVLGSIRSPAEMMSAEIEKTVLDMSVETVTNALEVLGEVV
jgi:hypothetical protein